MAQDYVSNQICILTPCSILPPNAHGSNQIGIKNKRIVILKDKLDFE